jgi:HTH-type transcriptional regulator / antitoxin HipB
MKNPKEAIRKAKTFEKLLDIKYGKIGSPKRDNYEENANYYVITEILKETRKEAKITQQQLADKIGTQKSYISRLENGKCDIQLSTLFKIFETGLGKHVDILIK